MICSKRLLLSPPDWHVIYWRPTAQRRQFLTLWPQNLFLTLPTKPHRHFGYLNIHLGYSWLITFTFQSNSSCSGVKNCYFFSIWFFFFTLALLHPLTLHQNCKASPGRACSIPLPSFWWWLIILGIAWLADTSLESLPPTYDFLPMSVSVFTGPSCFCTLLLFEGHQSYWIKRAHPTSVWPHLNKQI